MFYLKWVWYDYYSLTWLLMGRAAGATTLPLFCWPVRFTAISAFTHCSTVYFVLPAISAAILRYRCAMPFLIVIRWCWPVPFLLTCPFYHHDAFVDRLNCWWRTHYLPLRCLLPIYSIIVYSNIILLFLWLFYWGCCLKPSSKYLSLNLWLIFWLWWSKMQSRNACLHHGCLGCFREASQLICVSQIQIF